jgi:hypothetical protein
MHCSIRRVPILLASTLACAALVACDSAGSRPNPDPTPTPTPTPGTVRIAYLHHSTGGVIWGGGVAGFFDAYNAAHGTTYQIGEYAYPSTAGGYPWSNYPYDYWNLWVNHTGASRDRGELNLDDLAAAADVIVWKHCFPVSDVVAGSGTGDVSSESKTLANYQAQYAALKARMRQFPDKKFIVWTGAALVQSATTPENAQRARQFFDWVKNTWDERGDNIFVWDFRALETSGSGNNLYLRSDYSAGDSHPNDTLARLAAPLIGQRIVDVIEGRGDTGSLTGQ